MIYVVLGMHKSGTTLVAQTLHRSGINMGFDLAEGDDTYSREKCEGYLLREINNTLLRSERHYSLDIDLREPIVTRDEARPIAAKLMEEQSGYPDWGMKDPRLVGTYPSFWKNILDRHRLIAVYRDPAMVANYYVGHPRFIDQKTEVLVKSLRLWKEYNLRILDCLADHPESETLLINYDRLMDGKGLEQLQKFVGTELIDCRRKSTRRYVLSSSPLTYSIVSHWLGIPALQRKLEHLAVN